MKQDVPIVKVVYKSKGKKVGYILLDKKIRNFAARRAPVILKRGNILIDVQYPDGAHNKMTCKTINDVRWAITSFYREYRKYWL